MEERTSKMKRTPFYELHKRHGGKIVPFAGYEMPVQYAGIIEEHKSVRNGVGVFDVSHMGEFFASGVNALSFLQKVTVNDVSKLSPGKAQYSAMCYDDGGIVDDLLVYMLAENEYMIVVNASNIEKDFAWMKKFCPADVRFENKSDETALLAIQGPKSLETLQKLTPVDLKAIPYYNFVKGTVDGIEMIISRTGYTGELGFEIYFSNQHGEKIWNAIFKAGKEFGIAPIGLGARDTLRLEMGYCLYGNDINDETTPLEAGLGWIVKTEKGDFLGKAVLEKQKKEGLKRKLCGFVMTERGIPRKGYVVTDENGNQIGQVTSGTQSPVLQQGIGLAYLSIDKTTPGTEIFIQIRERPHKAKVSKLPFISKKT